MQLNLPIPEDPKYLFVHVFFLDPENKPLKVSFGYSFCFKLSPGG
jgi:hypothetical protein